MTVYGTPGNFRTYLTARGLSATNSADDTIVNGKLLVASEWIDSKYGDYFPGRRVAGRNQDREWPRNGAVDAFGYAISSIGYPTEVENATYEAARRELDNPGSLSVDFTPNPYKRAAVSGAVSVEYNIMAQATDRQIQLQIVDEILRPVLDECAEESTLSGESGR